MVSYLLDTKSTLDTCHQPCFCKIFVYKIVRRQILRKIAIYSSKICNIFTSTLQMRVKLTKYLVLVKRLLKKHAIYFGVIQCLFLIFSRFVWVLELPWQTISYINNSRYNKLWSCSVLIELFLYCILANDMVSDLVWNSMPK